MRSFFKEEETANDKSRASKIAKNEDKASVRKRRAQAKTPALSDLDFSTDLQMLHTKQQMQHRFQQSGAHSPREQENLDQLMVIKKFNTDGKSLYDKVQEYLMHN